MKQLMKWLMLAGGVLLLNVYANAQQLTNVYLTQQGKAAYLISVPPLLVVLSDSGKISEIKTAASGTIVYNTVQQIEQIGEVKIGFNYQGQINRIGNSTLLYDFNGRVDRIGDLNFRYNYQQLLVSVGDQGIRYNPDQTIDQFGRYRIMYNYNKQVQKIDDSNGLIILQLKYHK
ncbi:MAG TPA: hypothetical protein VJ552_05995 [Sediminibacterium sp.]|nr:hypothetical protein [Sediminibacterium sp.]